MSEKMIGVKSIFLYGLIGMTLLSGCGSSWSGQDNTDAFISEKAAEGGDTSEVSETESVERLAEDKEFELTEQGKIFLTRMCRELVDFDDQTMMDEEFWRDFLFYSYTGASAEDAVMEQIYREDLGFEETVVKVSLQEADAYAELIFGTGLPDVKPSFADMEPGQTSCYYQDGYYYIGVSDFPDYRFTFAEWTVCEGTDTGAIVKYTIDLEDESNVGTVSFTVFPEENENGFIIGSKCTEFE